MNRFNLIFLLLCGLLLAVPAHAAPNSTLRYFEGTLLIEEANDHGNCLRQVGKTKDVQISWNETRKGSDSKISGWMVVAGGSPGKLEGAQSTRLTVTSNYYVAHFNTPITLSLDIADGKITGILRETPSKLSFEENMCFWQKAKLTLTEKTAETNVVQRMREHAAWYKAHAHESRGDYHVRYDNFAEAAAAHDQAIAEVDGILPETHNYFTGLLNYTVQLYSKIKDYERAAQRYQRIMDIGVRQSKIGADDPALYRAWMRLSTYLKLAKRTDEAIIAIERAARLEDKAKDVDLDERLLRHRLQGSIYIAAKMIDKAQAISQDEIKLASAEAGPDDPRTFEARVQSVRVLLMMKDHARAETAFESMAKEITTRFGESHALARSSNEQLGMHYYHSNEEAKARIWLESAFRGHRALVDSAAQAVRDNEDARSVLAALLDIYIKEGIVPKDFLAQVSAGQVTLDDLPFRDPLAGGQNLSTFKIKPLEWDKLLKR